MEDLPYEKYTQEDKKHGEGNGKPPWQIYNMRDCQYAATLFCSVDTPSPAVSPLDRTCFKKVINLVVTAED